MIELKFTGTADEIREELCQLFQSHLEHRSLRLNPVSDVSSDTLKTATEAGKQADEAPKPRRGRPAKTDTSKLPEGPALNVVAQNISTGDERVDPETALQVDDGEAVDRTPYAEPEAKVYTMEDVRNAATPYIKRHTMALAQIDLQEALEAAVGIRQISKLDPANQEMLKKAVEAFEAAGKVETRFVKAA